jgi:acetyl esterase/lipase
MNVSPCFRAFRVSACVSGFILLLALLLDHSPATAAPYEQRKDLVYAETHGTGLLMDVFVPTGKTNGLAIIDIASGAWYSDRGKIRDHTLAQLYDIHCARGYTVFAIRPGSRTRYTALEMDQHVKLAIRHVKQNAAQYGIDPTRLGLTGASAGGHLATLAALTPMSAKPDSRNPVERHDTSVRAVGVFFPPTDFLDWKDGRMADLNILGPLLQVGGAGNRSESELKEMARAISPLQLVKRTDVPFLLIHGDADKVVPLQHSERLRDALVAAGGQAELIVKAGGGHPWLTLPEEVKRLADWFDKTLSAAPPGEAPH